MDIELNHKVDSVTAQQLLVEAGRLANLAQELIAKAVSLSQNAADGIPRVVGTNQANDPINRKLDEGAREISTQTDLSSSPSIEETPIIKTKQTSNSNSTTLNKRIKSLTRSDEVLEKMPCSTAKEMPVAATNQANAPLNSKLDMGTKTSTGNLRSFGDYINVFRTIVHSQNSIESKSSTFSDKELALIKNLMKNPCPSSNRLPVTAATEVDVPSKMPRVDAGSSPTKIPTDQANVPYNGKLDKGTRTVRSFRKAFSPSVEETSITRTKQANNSKSTTSNKQNKSFTCSDEVPETTPCLPAMPVTAPTEVDVPSKKPQVDAGPIPAKIPTNQANVPFNGKLDKGTRTVRPIRKAFSPSAEETHITRTKQANYSISTISNKRSKSSTRSDEVHEKTPRFTAERNDLAESTEVDAPSKKPQVDADHGPAEIPTNQANVPFNGKLDKGTRTVRPIRKAFSPSAEETHITRTKQTNYSISTISNKQSKSLTRSDEVPEKSPCATAKGMTVEASTEVDVPSKKPQVDADHGPAKIPTNQANVPFNGKLDKGTRTVRPIRKAFSPYAEETHTRTKQTNYSISTISNKRSKSLTRSEEVPEKTPCATAKGMTIEAPTEVDVPSKKPQVDAGPGPVEIPTHQANAPFNGKLDKGTRTVRSFRKAFSPSVEETSITRTKQTSSSTSTTSNKRNRSLIRSDEVLDENPCSIAEGMPVAEPTEIGVQSKKARLGAVPDLNILIPSTDVVVKSKKARLGAVPPNIIIPPTVVDVQLTKSRLDNIPGPNIIIPYLPLEGLIPSNNPNMIVGNYYTPEGKWINRPPAKIDREELDFKKFGEKVRASCERMGVIHFVLPKEYFTGNEEKETVKRRK